ncbi:glutathione S-transferase T2-like [Lotus japonicus]|uniref:glutathione S-transferase T2-like n=1 Tax=Lotus japonicus TaxID=34305 RepID=UPI00258A2DA3|nr:glutathione S-transferase T2-like [Lotus japonicus]
MCHPLFWYQQQPFIHQPPAKDSSQNPNHFIHPPPPPNYYSPQISSNGEKVPETQFEYVPDELDESDEPTFPAEGDNHSPKKQRLKWCENDDIILLQTWLNISNDSVTGTDQKEETFWRRIEHQYNKYRKIGSSEKKWAQLKAHFHTLSKAVSTFVGCYKKVTNPPKSGYSERDIMANACSLYSEMVETKTFKFEHAWRVLKDEPKWNGETMSIYSKQSRHSTDGVHTSIDGSEHEAVQIFSHPLGHKDTKRKVKAATTTSNNEERMTEAKSLVKEKTERMARLERLKKNDQLKMINDILLQDTST